MDDWKGEDRIRNVKRAPNASHVSPARRAASGMRNGARQCKRCPALLGPRLGPADPLYCPGCIREMAQAATPKGT